MCAALDGAFHVTGATADPSSEKSRIRGNARRRAAQLCGCLYMAFRLLLPYENIGLELGIDADRALRVASDGRAHGDKFFAGEKCCRNRRDRERAVLQVATVGVSRMQQ